LPVALVAGRHLASPPAREASLLQPSSILDGGSEIHKVPPGLAGSVAE
jgi:hypothetical protein